MGLLKGTTCYLAGPAEKSEDPLGWRKDIAINLRSIGVRPIDPLIKPKWIDEDLKVSPSAYKSMYLGGDSDCLDGQGRVRTLCKRMVAISDWMIVRLNNEPTVGTIEEMVDAKNQNKPVFLVCSKKIISMWALNLIADNIGIANEYHYETMGSLWKYINYLDGLSLDEIVDEEPEAFRWLFLTYWHRLGE